MASTDIPSGQLQPEDSWGEYNRTTFVIRQLLNRIQTVTLVRVDAVTNAGGVSPVGFVDVTPLVNQIDSDGHPVPHATIYGIPYSRLQGGANAVIIDPAIGDIGICGFASRDISHVKATQAQANPGSFRTFDYADGLYIGGALNGTPTQYVQFSTAGITLHSPTAIVLSAPDVSISASTVEIAATTSTTVTTPTFSVNGATVLNGTLNQTGGGTASISGSMSVAGDVHANGTSLHTHTHTSTTPGTPTSAPL